MNKGFKILEDVKNILTQTLSTKVDSSQPIFVQLVEAVQKLNEDLNSQERLLQRVEKKFETRVLEQISQKIGIYEVELSISISSLETTYSNITLLFGKLCDTTIFMKDIKDKLSNIDEHLKASAQQLQLDPSSSSAHFTKIKFFTHNQAELLRKEARTREILTEI